MNTDLTERESALLGPRDMKPRGSREWCLQTIYQLKRRWERLEYTEAEWKQTVKELKDVRAWEVLGYPDEDAMFQSEIGRTRKQADEDIKKLRTKREALKNNQNSRKSKNGNSDTTSELTFSKRDTEYLTARIARDRPDILEDMKSGKYKSVRAAALDAGIVRPRFTVPSDDVRAIARALVRHLTVDQIEELTSILVGDR